MPLQATDPLVLLQLVRQRNTASEELIQLRGEVERHSEALLRVAKEREMLTKEKASQVVQLAASERENWGLVEEIAGLRYGGWPVPHFLPLFR